MEKQPNFGRPFHVLFGDKFGKFSGNYSILSGFNESPFSVGGNVSHRKSWDERYIHLLIYHENEPGPCG